MIRRPPRSTLFPCPTLFRSWLILSVVAGCGRHPLAVGRPADHAPAGPASLVRAGSAIIRAAHGSSADSLPRSLGSQVLGTIPELDLALLRTPPALTDDAFVSGLHLDQRVVFAEPNEKLQTAEGAQSTVAFCEGRHPWSDVTDQQALHRIGAAEAARLADGRGVRVAILDTGID